MQRNDLEAHALLQESLVTLRVVGADLYSASFLATWPMLHYGITTTPTRTVTLGKRWRSRRPPPVRLGVGDAGHGPARPTGRR